MKVLVLTEDFINDQYIAKPILEALFADLGIPCRIDVLQVRFRGAAQLLDETRLAETLADNPMTDLFLLLVDRDCDRENHQARATRQEERFPNRVIACLPRQELEVWMLALYKDQLEVQWSEVVADCDPKERFAEPLLRTLSRRAEGPGAGRKAAMEALKGRWKTVLGACEELRDLSSRLAARRASQS